jgi:hypothetical protein
MQYSTCPSLRLRVLSLTAVCLAVLGCRASPPPMPTAATSAELASAGEQLKRRSDSVADLSAYTNSGRGTAIIPRAARQRDVLLEERRRRQDSRDAGGLAHLNSVLALEAFSRAAGLTTRWLDHRDAASGLFPTTLGRTGRFWRYQDTAADLFPHLALATRLLIPERYPEIVATLTAERALSPGFPKDISLDSRAPIERLSGEKRMLGAAEYAKDGLLPLVEMVGGDPWLERLREVMDEVLLNARTPTPRGPIPANTTEVNGTSLQVLARLYWLTRDPRYLEMGNRISAAYLDDALPKTRHLPVERWDFVANTPIGETRFFLGDHGNEIVSGLVEWHRVELLTGAAAAEQHRASIRKMLDALLAKGRDESGLWYTLISVPGGNVRDDTLTDNWGYLAQAYLNQADIERTVPGGEPAAGQRFEEAVSTTLRALSEVDFYPWEEGKMDGYADTLEGTVYVLRYLHVPEAAAWLDRQIPVLYGFQQEDGRVTDENIDGNFVRTSLLYGLWMTQGVRLDPWSERVSLGAAPDGECVEVRLHASSPWSGRLVFDSQRHRTNVSLPSDYPRLNQWPEWFSVSPDRAYTLTNTEGDTNSLPGHELAAGIPVSLAPDHEYQLRACPR